MDIISVKEFDRDDRSLIVLKVSDFHTSQGCHVQSKVVCANNGFVVEAVVLSSDRGFANYLKASY